MRRRALGSQGLVVSAIGLGCNAMASVYGATDESEAIATIRQALDLGVCFLDTADVYGSVPGENEQLVARAIKGRHQEVVLATKCGIERLPDGGRRVRGQPEYVRAACEGSLRRLKVDHIDLTTNTGWTRRCR